MRVENWPDNVLLVHLPRELQRHTELQTTIDEVGKRGVLDVVVDFSSTDIVGSLTFSRLLELRSVLRESGRKLVLCNVAPATRDAFAAARTIWRLLTPSRRTLRRIANHCSMSMSMSTSFPFC